MNSPRVTNLLLALGVVLTLSVATYAQNVGAKQSYHIKPPLRIAGRPVDGIAPRGVTQADPFKPREAKEKSITLALQGYCLVSLRDQQQWVQGSPKIQVVRGGKLYLFSSERARAIFLAAPHLYLPVLDGDCAVTFAATGKRVSGKLEHGLVHNKRVYFFADQAHLQSFQSAPDEYVNADLVDGGACVVSKLLEKRFALGLSETVAVVDGRRYFFASTYQRRIFEQNPMPFLVQPLRNPQAAARLEVPAFSDSFEIDFGASGERRVGPIARSPNTAESAIGKIKGRKTDGQTIEDDHGELIQGRALSGYCPVTIRTQNTWRRGKVKFRHTFDGKVYFLAGSEELAAFQANPAMYAPVLSGDSIVAFAADFERVAGTAFHAFIYKERLYLFADEKERKAFRDNPAKFENADIAAQGYCVVSRVDAKQEILGDPKFETVYCGKRYRFVSADYLAKFLNSPKVYADE